jgi:hypothetical protein
MPIKEIGKTLVRDLVVRTLTTVHKFATLMATNEMFVYENGIYVGGGKAESIIKRATEKALKLDYRVHDSNETIGRIKVLTVVDNDFFEHGQQT